LGFRVISISYFNPYTINTYCQSDPSTSTCYSDIRNEVLFGQDTSSQVSVNEANSIYNRILKTIIYANTLFPSQGWNQYYSGANITWKNIVISGHSQGAGFATFIGVKERVMRVVQYGGVTDLFDDGTSPSWIFWPSATPHEEFFWIPNKI